jgi:hypothetical protein
VKANRDRLVAALAAPRPTATRFAALVDSWVDGADVYNFSPWNAALLGQLTNDARYCTAAVNAVDTEVRAEEASINAGQTPEVAADSYLGVGHIIGDLALVYDWCYEAVPPNRRTAWLTYADQAVWNVWNHDAAQWNGRGTPWTGWATDDPSDNYYYSFLRATMLLGLAAHDEAPRAAGWLTQFRDTKLGGELVPTFNRDLVGGGSREGTGYGVAMRDLWELYDFWEASTGEQISTLTGHTRASMLSFLHQVVPTLDRIAPTGDHSRDSTASFFDYHRSYLQELITLFPADPVAPRAQTLLANSSVPEMGSQFMFVYDFLYENAGVTRAQLDGLGTAHHAPGIGELYARSGWDQHATWINLIAGPYTQSHAHQDQGSLMIYKDGWLAYDENIESHSGLRQEVESHSVVRIVDGQTVEQQVGTEAKMLALHRGSGWLHAAADLTPVYAGQAAVSRVERELLYLEPDCVIVYDRVATAAGTEQVWQLVSPVAAAINGNHATVSAAHTLEVERVAPAQATASVHDYTSDTDLLAGFRYDERVPGGDVRHLHVLWIDGAVGAATPQVDGVTVSLGGRAVAVKFNHDAVGGSLALDGITTTLGSGLDPLPEEGF